MYAHTCLISVTTEKDHDPLWFKDIAPGPSVIVLFRAVVDARGKGEMYELFNVPPRTSCSVRRSVALGTYRTSCTLNRRPTTVYYSSIFRTWACLQLGSPSFFARPPGPISCRKAANAAPGRNFRVRAIVHVPWFANTPLALPAAENSCQSNDSCAGQLLGGLAWQMSHGTRPCMA